MESDATPNQLDFGGRQPVSVTTPQQPKEADAVESNQGPRATRAEFKGWPPQGGKPVAARTKRRGHTGKP